MYSRVLTSLTLWGCLVLPGGQGALIGSPQYHTSARRCDSSSVCPNPSSTTACYHVKTHGTCCMPEFTKSVDGSIVQECLCGCEPVRPTTATTLTTTAATTPTITSTTTTTPTTTLPSTTTVRPTTTATTPTTTTVRPTTPATIPTTTLTTTRPTTVKLTTAKPTTVKPTTVKPTTTTLTTARPTSTVVPTTLSTTLTTSKTTTILPLAPPVVQSPRPSTAPVCSTSFRIMNGQDVEDPCSIPGISNITQWDAAGEKSFLVCQAFLTTATIDGRSALVFQTTKACTDGVEKMTKLNMLAEINIAELTFPVISNIFSVVPGPNGLSYLVINMRYANWLTDSKTCQQPACRYDNKTMFGLVDTSNCTVVSWGASSTGPKFQHTGLHEAPVSLNPTGCANIPIVAGATNTTCYKSKDNQKLYSQGDTGAPVYCYAPSTKEHIVVGSVAEQLNYGTFSELKVIGQP